MESQKHRIASRRNYLKGRLAGASGAILSIMRDGAAVTSEEYIMLGQVLHDISNLVDEWDNNTQEALDKAYKGLD